jgi:hypothetical protein
VRREVRKGPTFEANKKGRTFSPIADETQRSLLPSSMEDMDDATARDHSCVEMRAETKEENDEKRRRTESAKDVA